MLCSFPVQLCQFAPGLLIYTGTVAKPEAAAYTSNRPVTIATEEAQQLTP